VHGVEAQVTAACARGDHVLEFAKKHRIPTTHRDFRALLADKDIDVVDICTPPVLHAEMIIAAARPSNELKDPGYLPTHFVWKNFTTLWSGGLGNNLGVSLKIAAGATVLALLVAMPAAYYTARRKFRGRMAFLVLVLVTQMFTSALLLMKAHGREPAPDFLSRLQSMYRLLSTLADNRGQLPQIGDCDDGRVELLADDLERMLRPPDQRDSLAISSLLGIGECLFSEDYRGRKEEAGWYGLNGCQQSPSHAAQPARRSKIFPRSGLAVGALGEAEAIFLAVPNGIAGRGSHTHNDKLSIILRIGGEEFLTDSGTCCYTRDADRRNRLRSTAAHNTVMIDGEEQNRFSTAPGALFSISDDAKVSPIKEKLIGDTLSFTASHDGYRRIGVTHTRTLTLDPNRGVLIEDDFTGNGEHEFEASLHLPSSWNVQLSQVTGSTVNCRVSGPRPMEIEWSATSELRLNSAPVEISKAYGITRMATRVIVNAKSHTSFKLVTRLSIGI